MNRTNGSYERFKLFGLQRTATNLVWRGVTENFEVESAEIGGEWKHGPIGRSAEAGCAIIVCTRHPLAWLDAMYRFSMEIDDRDGCPHFRRSWTFEEFCCNPHYDWPNPVLRWNKVNRDYLYWLSRNPGQGFLVRSEDLLGINEQRKLFTEIGKIFNWKRRAATIQTFERRVLHWTEELGEVLDTDYYRSGRFGDKFTPTLRDSVIRSVDNGVVSDLRYVV